LGIFDSTSRRDTHDNAKAEKLIATAKYEKVLTVDYIDEHARYIIAHHDDQAERECLTYA